MQKWKHQALESVCCSVWLQQTKQEKQSILGFDNLIRTLGAPLNYYCSAYAISFCFQLKHGGRKPLWCSKRSWICSFRWDEGRRGFCTRQNKSWLSSAESAKDSEVPQSTNTNYNVNKKPTHKTGLLAFVSFNSWQTCLMVWFTTEHFLKLFQVLHALESINSSCECVSICQITLTEVWVLACAQK